VEIHIILSRYHQMQFNLGMVLAIRADAGTVFKDIKFLVRASKVPTTMPHIHQLNLVFDETKEPEMLFAQLSNARRVVQYLMRTEEKSIDWTSEILEAFISGFERPISSEIFELLFSDAIIFLFSSVIIQSCRPSCSQNKCLLLCQIMLKHISCSVASRQTVFMALWTKPLE
jgi:hypothetical protein